MFSSMLRQSTRARSWYTVSIPNSLAFFVPLSSILCPSKNNWPLVALIAPERILMRVDFPAPLSPRSATTSLRGSLKVTLLRAFTPP